MRGAPWAFLREAPRCPSGTGRAIAERNFVRIIFIRDKYMPSSLFLRVCAVLRHTPRRYRHWVPSLRPSREETGSMLSRSRA